ASVNAGDAGGFRVESTNNNQIRSEVMVTKPATFSPRGKATLLPVVAFRLRTFQLPISWSLVVVCWACDGAATVTAMMVASNIFFMPISLGSLPILVELPTADGPALFREAFGDEQGRCCSLFPNLQK